MSKRIMIIDDSSSLRQVVAITLQSYGFETIEACDGQDALARLDNGKIHLMICDVHMPNMDGLTFLKEIRRHPLYRFTPVIMLTTDADPERIRDGQQAGARAWIMKPFKSDELLNAVSKLIMP